MLYSRADLVGGLFNAALNISHNHLHLPLFHRYVYGGQCTFLSYLQNFLVSSFLVHHQLDFKTLLHFCYFVLCASAVLVVPFISVGAPVVLVLRSFLTKSVCSQG